MKPPPSNSVFKVEDTFDGRQITIPKPKRKLGELGGAAFLAFWLCGWAVGEVFVTRAIWQSLQKAELNGGFWFMMAWLGGWTVGGIFAMKALYASAKGEPAEVITLGMSELKHIKKASKVYRKEEIENVRLDVAGGVHLLYFDHGSDRIYVGEQIREPEREWLFSVIKEWKGA